MNAADGVSGNGNGVRGEPPGKMRIAPDAPSCECGAFEVESLPCGCQAYVACKAGVSIAPLFKYTETNPFLKSVYSNLPEFCVPGTEHMKFRTDEEAAQVPKDKPIPTGRPSTKRKKGAMDFLAAEAYKARHPEG